jgi:hypothetical protein
MSSKISLTAETVMTNIRGRRIVGCPFVILIEGIVYIKHIIKPPPITTIAV